MSEEELKNKILELVKSSKRLLTNRDIANRLNIKKSLVNKLINELIDEGKLEYWSAGGITYIRIPKEEA